MPRTQCSKPLRRGFYYGASPRTFRYTVMATDTL
jgi:hypothetical protein